MKYIITGINAENQRVVATLDTKTTRKSKLLDRIDKEFRDNFGYSIETLKELYVGKLDKHTQLQ